MLHTGDLAYIDSDGLVYIKGRLRRMYLSVMDGQPAKIFPYVIETEVSKHEAVVEACAVGRLKENSTYYEMYVYVVSNDKEHENTIKEELFELVHANVPSKMQPKEIVFVDELPKTTNGKVDFMRLEKLEM